LEGNPSPPCTGKGPEPSETGKLPKGKKPLKRGKKRTENPEKPVDWRRKSAGCPKNGRSFWGKRDRIRKKASEKREPRLKDPEGICAKALWGGGTWKLRCSQEKFR